MPVLLIDAFNVLHVVGVLPPELAGPDLAGLGVLIERSRFRRDPVTLFCDGRAPVPRPELPRGIRAKWSGPDRPADDLIIAQIRATTTPRRCLVVTSDRQIQREAQRRRCGVMRSEEFMAILARDAAAPTITGPVGPAIFPPDAIPRWLRDEAAELSRQRPRIGEGADPDDPAGERSGEPGAARIPGAYGDPIEPRSADENDADPTDKAAKPPKRRANPLFPADILSEAASLLELAEEADEDVGEPDPADAGTPGTPGTPDAGTAAAPARSTPTDPLLVAFAEAMREAGEALSRHRTRNRPGRKGGRGAEPAADLDPDPRFGGPFDVGRAGHRTAPNPPPRARSPILPADILAEAERLLDEADRARGSAPPKPPTETPRDLPS